MKSCAPTHSSLHVCTNRSFQTHPSLPPSLSLPPSRPIVLPGTSFLWHRWWWENELQRETDTQGMAAADSSTLHPCLRPYSFFFHINQTYLLHTSSHLPPGHPSLLLHLNRLDLSLPTSICQSMNVYGLLEPSPAAIHPLDPSTSICSSNCILPCIVTFHTPINLWNVTFHSFIFFPPSTHSSIHPYTSYILSPRCEWCFWLPVMPFLNLFR